MAPKLVSFSDQIHSMVTTRSPLPPAPEQLLQSSCIANATFAALGGFKESVRTGMKVQVVGDGVEQSHGVVQSIAERRGVASVQFSDDEYCFGPNKTLDVPLARLLPSQKEVLPLDLLQVGPELCRAICSVLDTAPPLLRQVNSRRWDTRNASLGLCRVFAEMRTRACVSLLHHVEQSREFLGLFLESGCCGELKGQITSDPGE